MRSDSYAAFFARDVWSACEAYLKDRKTQLDAKREPIIQDAMKGYWFRKPRSREDALAAIKRYGNWHPYFLVAHQGGFDAERVRVLLSLVNAQNPNARIFVGAEDADILKGYLIDTRPETAL